MPEVKKSAISFESSNGADTVAGYYYVCPDVPPRAILQLSHGMCEYIGRYDDFAGYMARHGYVVCGNDHLGHGATSDGVNGTDGFFAEKNGCDYVLRDLNQMNRLAHAAYPELPLILLGHSMGSFFARAYAARYPDTLDALVLSGTGGPNPMAGVGLVLTEWISRRKGAKYRSKFLNSMAFGQYLKRVENPATPYDWITRDAQIVAKYAADEKCTFIFTAAAFHDLMTILRAVSRPEWAGAFPKALPVALFAGDMDPVGDYGKGVEKVYRMLEDAGVKDVSIKLYPGARHEILNEINRAEVYEDVRAWCDAHLK
jgi:alpha-beta hydrolase superfamily lysophospholipase